MITFEYKGEQIGEFPPESEKVLQTAMKYCEDDITVKSNIYPTEEELDPYKHVKDGSCGDVVFYGSYFTQKSDASIELKLYYANATAAHGYTYTVVAPGGTEEVAATPVFQRQGGADCAVIVISRIPAKNFPKAATVKISDGTNTLVSQASVLTYCQSTIRKKQTAKLHKDAAAATFWYGIMYENMFG